MTFIHGMDCSEMLGSQCSLEGLKACAGQHVLKKGKSRVLTAHPYSLVKHLLALFVAPRSPASTSIIAMYSSMRDTPHKYRFTPVSLFSGWRMLIVRDRGHLCPALQRA